MLKNTLKEAQLVMTNGPSPAKQINFWQRFTEPAASICEPELRRRARLLSALLATLFLLGILATSMTILTIDQPSNFYISAGGTLILLAAYYLSRTQYYNLAAWLMVSTICISIFAVVVFNPQGYPLYFLILGVMVSSLFLSKRETALVTVAILVGLGLLWSAFPALSARDISGAMFGVLSVAALGIVAIRIRQEDMEQIHEQQRLLVEDIAKREQVEQSLGESEKRFRALAEYSMEEVSMVDVDGKLIYESPSQRRPLGYPPDSFVGRNLFELFHPDDRVPAAQLLTQITAEPGIHREAVFRLQHQDGSWRWMEGIITNLLNEPAVRAIVINYRDITERHQAEEAARERSNELATIYRASEPLLNIGADLTAVAEEIAQIMVKEFHLVDCGVLLVEKTSKELKRIRRAGTFVTQPLFPHLSLDGPGLTVTAARTGQTVYAADINADPRYIRSKAETQSELVVPLKVGAEILGVLDLQSPQKSAFDERTQRQVTAFAERAALALKNAQLYETVSAELAERHRVEDILRQRLADFEAVNQLSAAMREAQTLEQLLPIALDVTLEMLHATAGSLWLYNKTNDELCPTVLRRYDQQKGLPLPPPEKPGEGIVGYVFATRQLFIENDIHESLRLPEATRRQIPPGMGAAVTPIRAGDNVIGVLSIHTRLPHALTPEEIHLLTTLSEIAGNAIQRSMFHQQTERHLQHLLALSEIDRAISSSFDLRISLGTLLKHVIAQLNIDAADVLLFDSNSLGLERVAEHGFRSRTSKLIQPRLDKSYAGEAILNRQMVKIKNIKEQKKDQFLAALGEQEAFVDYYAVPLMAKGYTKGVLEIFKRSSIEPDLEWLDFLNTLAGQAAIAIDNATLFDGLQRSNAELSMAYDATIEGWSHALDLRDKETEGHTQRVTEMTLKLARAFDLSNDELAQVRWGSLLHDIGKMGVPDTILLKPGPLTEEEWVVMKKHPTFAQEMIAPIHYLHAALDIPYCHHEKWDGTGYPRGLKGEQIPLTARIFAIVDVWDALRSDRPYRAAWPEEKVRTHIQSLSGTHFDPRVVDTFLTMMNR